MTLNQIRLVKQLLATVLVCFSALLAYQFLSARNTSKRPSSTTLSTNRANPVARGVEITRLDADGEKIFELRAAESIGQTQDTQTFRDVEIQFEAGKTEPVPLTVTADLCEYDVESSAVHLEGNVVIVDEEDLRIEAATMNYRPKPKRVWTDSRIKYYRGGLVGEAGGLVYQVAGNAFELGRGVDMTFTPDDGGAPVRIESVWAKIRRRERLVRFVDEVRVRQGSYRLRSGLLTMHLTENESGLEHLVADRDVRMVLDQPPDPFRNPRKPLKEDEESDAASEAQPESVHPLDQPGRKRLASQRLEIDFRPDGSTMQRMRALKEAKLTFEPPVSGEKPGMRRELQGNTLIFQFDGEGRLTVLNGRGNVSLTLEPEGGKPEDARRVTARELESRFNPETGELRMAKCTHQVKFTHGSLHAEAEEGVYRSQRELLTLTESPRLWDEGAELEAEEVRIQVVTGALEAIGKVRSTMASASSDSIGFLPGEKGDKVYFLAEHLEYDRALDLAIYTGTARGFRGANRLEAERIAVAQTKGELEATDAVRTTLPQNASPSSSGQRDGEPEPARKNQKDVEPQLTHTRAGHLLYRSDSELLTYTKEVQMTSGDFVLRGEKVEVNLQQGGESVKQIDAEGNVEIESPTGKARGDKATYVPEREEVRVMGELATLEDGDKVTEGKELTFFLSDDKIFVDGREQRRTKTIYSGSRP